MLGNRNEKLMKICRYRFTSKIIYLKDQINDINYLKIYKLIKRILSKNISGNKSFEEVKSKENEL